MAHSTKLLSLFECQDMSVKPNGVKLWKREQAGFFSFAMILAIFRLVPISGILCVSCSIHLLSYIISSIQVSNFMSHNIPSEISNCTDRVAHFLKGDVASHAKHKTIYICLYSLTAVTQELRYTLCLLQPVSEEPLAGGSISDEKMFDILERHS